MQRLFPTNGASAFQIFASKSPLSGFVWLSVLIEFFQTKYRHKKFSRVQEKPCADQTIRARANLKLTLIFAARIASCSRPLMKILL